MELIDALELRRRLPMTAAIDALKLAFASEDPGAGPIRTRMETPGGQLLLMPATGVGGVGAKLVTLTPANPGRGRAFVNAVYVLFSGGTQEPEAVIDGAALTALRTAAVSGLATSLLARHDARRLVVFGAGVQARSHVEAMRAVRPIEEVVIVSRTLERAEALAREVDGLVGEWPEVASADIVCTCTTSEDPVFDGIALPAGVHVNAVGAYEVRRRELDTETVRRARLVVETRDVAMAEAGDVVIPIEEGVVGPDHVAADLAEVVRGARVRRGPEDVTVFKSVGMAFEDLVVARAAVGAR